MEKGGFKYERELTIFSVVLGIVSTGLLIKVLLMQHDFFKSKLEEQKNGDSKS